MANFVEIIHPMGDMGLGINVAFPTFVFTMHSTTLFFYKHALLHLGHVDVMF
jgi:hypothetical protein